MSATTRDRLVRLLGRSEVDLAEAALLCCAEAEPELDVDAALLRLDALADALASTGFRPREPEGDARRLATYLAGELGFTGDVTSYHHPDNALLTRVLERRRGLPITLSILYAAIARRLGMHAYLVHLPGHVVTAVAGSERPVILDPFHDGALLEEADLARRVAEVSGGQAAFHRAMLRPASAADVVRRLLNNLTRDFHARQQISDALWTVELKLLLPNRAVEDHRIHGELLGRVGRFDAAARAFETYLELTGGTAPDAEEVRRAAIHSRARMN